MGPPGTSAPPTAGTWRGRVGACQRVRRGRIAARGGGAAPQSPEGLTREDGLTAQNCARRAGIERAGQLRGGVKGGRFGGAAGLTRVLVEARPFLKWRKGQGRERCARSCSAPSPTSRPCSPRVALGLQPPRLGGQPVPALQWAGTSTTSEGAIRGQTAAARLDDRGVFHATSPRSGTGGSRLPGPAAYSRP